MNQCACCISSYTMNVLLYVVLFVHDGWIDRWVDAIWIQYGTSGWDSKRIYMFRTKNTICRHQQVTFLTESITMI